MTYESGRVNFKVANGRLSIVGVPWYELFVEGSSISHEGNFVVQASGFNYLWCDELFVGSLSKFKRSFPHLAEKGCTEQEITAITGHRTSKEVTRYTRSASQKKRAESALTRLSDFSTEERQ